MGTHHQPILATDLDGTFIPMEDQPLQVEALKELKQHLWPKGPIQLIYVTGRDINSVTRAINEHDLPIPQMIISDVGTSIHQLQGGHWIPSDTYFVNLASIVSDVTLDRMRETMEQVEGCRLQQKDHQGYFKASFECDADQLATLTQRFRQWIQENDLPYNIISSLDPFAHVGLIDLLPRGISKNYALQWLIRQGEIESSNIIYAGDSGNDLEVFRSTLKCIAVGNMEADTKKKVEDLIYEDSCAERIYLAQQAATIGVLEGLQHFEMVPAYTT